jgi:ribosomal protein S18 acetylase RimI-like enzyme
VTRVSDTTTIRAATIADAPEIAALSARVHAMHAEAHPDMFQPADLAPRSAEDTAALVVAAGPLCVVAERDGAFAGYARAELQEEPASAIKRASRVLYVHEMAVAPAHRQHGVGGALLAAMRERAASLGAGSVTLDVYAFNAGARAFYARAGFTALRERLVAPVPQLPPVPRA